MLTNILLGVAVISLGAFGLFGLFNILHAMYLQLGAGITGVIVLVLIIGAAAVPSVAGISLLIIGLFVALRIVVLAVFLIKAVLFKEEEDKKEEE